jgi:hypothetical protein
MDLTNCTESEFQFAREQQNQIGVLYRCAGIRQREPRTIDGRIYMVEVLPMGIADGAHLGHIPERRNYPNVDGRGDN